MAAAPLLTSAQYAEMRRKRADLDAKLKQMTAVERTGAANCPRASGVPRGAVLKAAGGRTLPPTCARAHHHLSMLTFSINS
jgi:hypothetical protein